MRSMAAELAAGRLKAVEAERLRAFRESSRRFAHELKNPLTPIRFAITKLRRDAAPDLQDTIDVLATEADRLDTMARSFAQFGRLPEGPAADVDVGELVAYTARATVPDRLTLTLDVAPGAVAPRVRGHHDTLARALSNVLLNAVDACGEHGHITVSVRQTELRGTPAVRIAVRDTGPGIAPEKLLAIWEPYVTEKPGGTGLGLAIARQAIESHGGDVFATSMPGNTEIGFDLPMNAGLPAITGEWHAV
jgi:signal transduction histidine kinase